MIQRYLILEYIEGGELFDYLIKKGRLPEAEAVNYFHQIINGINYCHQFNICHRDLKPENLLLDKQRDIIKIADFGMAALETSDKMLETSCGSPHYASPEIVSGKMYHGAPSDIWSCGIILFALLTGHLPFDDDNIRKLLLKVQRGKFVMPPELSPQAKDLIWKMLKTDPNERITMDEIMKHSLLRKYPIKHKYRQPVANHFTANINRPISDPSLVDREILKNLQTLWHGASKTSIIEKLMSDEKNSEKTFYWLLMKYRMDHGNWDLAPPSQSRQLPPPRSSSITFDRKGKRVTNPISPGKLHTRSPSSVSSITSKRRNRSRSRSHSRSRKVVYGHKKSSSRGSFGKRNSIISRSSTIDRMPPLPTEAIKMVEEAEKDEVVELEVVDVSTTRDVEVINVTTATPRKATMVNVTKKPDVTTEPDQQKEDFVRMLEQAFDFSSASHHAQFRQQNTEKPSFSNYRAFSNPTGTNGTRSGANSRAEDRRVVSEPVAKNVDENEILPKLLEADSPSLSILSDFDFEIIDDRFMDADEDDVRIEGMESRLSNYTTRPESRVSNYERPQSRASVFGNKKTDAGAASISVHQSIQDEQASVNRPRNAFNQQQDFPRRQPSFNQQHSPTSQQQLQPVQRQSSVQHAPSRTLKTASVLEERDEDSTLRIGSIIPSQRETFKSPALGSSSSNTPTFGNNGTFKQPHDGALLRRKSSLTTSPQFNYWRFSPEIRKTSVETMNTSITTGAAPGAAQAPGAPGGRNISSGSVGIKGEVGSKISEYNATSTTAGLGISNPKPKGQIKPLADASNTVGRKQAPSKLETTQDNSSKTSLLSRRSTSLFRKLSIDPPKREAPEPPVKRNWFMKMMFPSTTSAPMASQYESSGSAGATGSSSARRPRTVSGQSMRSTEFGKVVTECPILLSSYSSGFLYKLILQILQDWKKFGISNIKPTIHTVTGPGGNEQEVFVIKAKIASTNVLSMRSSKFRVEISASNMMNSETTVGKKPWYAGGKRTNTDDKSNGGNLGGSIRMVLQKGSKQSFSRLVGELEQALDDRNALIH